MLLDNFYKDAEYEKELLLLTSKVSLSHLGIHIVCIPLAISGTPYNVCCKIEFVNSIVFSATRYNVQRILALAFARPYPLSYVSRKLRLLREMVQRHHCGSWARHFRLMANADENSETGFDGLSFSVASVLRHDVGHHLCGWRKKIRKSPKLSIFI